MWNIITSNRLLDKKRKQQAQRKHLSTLKNLKSTIDNKAPAKYAFLYTRPKARLNKFQKQSQIDHQNSLLVQKMINISKVNKLNQSNQTINNGLNVFIKDSLNYGQHKKIQKQIDYQNQHLVRRLRSVTSQYGQQKLNKFVMQYKKVKSNLSRSRVNTTIYDFQMPARRVSVGAKYGNNSMASTKSRRLYSAKSFESNSRPFSAKI